MRRRKVLLRSTFIKYGGKEIKRAKPEDLPDHDSIFSFREKSRVLAVFLKPAFIVCSV
jgi:hypothetical protein